MAFGGHFEPAVRAKLIDAEMVGTVGYQRQVREYISQPERRAQLAVYQGAVFAKLAESSCDRRWDHYDWRRERLCSAILFGKRPKD